MNDGRQKSLIIPKQKKNIIYEHYTIVMWSHHFVVAFAARSVSLLLLFDGSKRNFNAALVSITLLVPLSWFRRHVYDRSILSAGSWKTCISSYWHNILTQQSTEEKLYYYILFWFLAEMLIHHPNVTHADNETEFIRQKREIRAFFLPFQSQLSDGEKSAGAKKAAHTLTSKSISNGWRAAGLTAAT